MNNYPHLSKLANAGETLSKFKRIMGGDAEAPIDAVAGEQPPPTIISEATKKIKERSGQPAQSGAPATPPPPPPTQPAAPAAPPQPQSKEATAMHEAGHKENKCKCGGVCAKCRADAGSKDNMRVVGTAPEVKTVPHEATGEQAWKDMEDKIAAAYPAYPTLAKQAAGVIAPPTSLLDTIKNVILKNPTTAATVGGGAFGGIANLLRGRGVLRGMGTGAITGLGTGVGANLGTAAGSLIGRSVGRNMHGNWRHPRTGYQKLSPAMVNHAIDSFDGYESAIAALDESSTLGGGAVGAIGGAGAGAYGGYQLAQALFGDENDGKNPRERKEEDKIASFQKEALGIPTLAGLSLGGIINLLRDRSISRGMLTGGLTGAGVDLGSGLGSAVGAEISGDPLSNTAAFGLASGGLGGGVGGYTLAQKLHDAISEDKDEDKMDNMLSQYKKVASMYPTLTKQAFEIPESTTIGDAFYGHGDDGSGNTRTPWIGKERPRGDDGSGNTRTPWIGKERPRGDDGSGNTGYFNVPRIGKERPRWDDGSGNTRTPGPMPSPMPMPGKGLPPWMRGGGPMPSPMPMPGKGLPPWMRGGGTMPSPMPMGDSGGLHDSWDGKIYEEQGEGVPPKVVAEGLKRAAAMYPTLTKQAFEMPEGISNAWSGIKDYFSNNPDAMNALIGGGAGAIGGGLLGYLKADKNESSAGDIFGHALLGAGAGAGAGYGANSLGSMVADTDWYKRQREALGGEMLQGGWDKVKSFFGNRLPNATLA